MAHGGSIGLWLFLALMLGLTASCSGEGDAGRGGTGGTGGTAGTAGASPASGRSSGGAAGDGGGIGNEGGSAGHRIQGTGGSAGSAELGGSGGAEIGGASTSGGVAGRSSAGTGSIEQCPPCVSPPHPSCRGMGPCGCGPYNCPAPEGPPGEALEGADCLGPVEADGEHVYYTQLGSLFRRGVNGTDPEPLAKHPQSPRSLLVDADGIYTAHFGGVTWGDKAGGAPRLLASVRDAVSVAVSGGFAFFAVVNQGDIYRVALDANGARGERIAAHAPHALVTAADDTHLYWVAAPDLLRVTHAGDTTETLATNARGNGVVLDAKNVYWISNDGIEAMPKSGGPPRRLIDATVQGIATDGVHVYWTENVAHVKRIPVEGGSAEVVAGDGFETGADLAVDATHVYWLSCAGSSSTNATLRRIAK